MEQISPSFIYAIWGGTKLYWYELTKYEEHIKVLEVFQIRHNSGWNKKNRQGNKMDNSKWNKIIEGNK